MDYAEGIIEYFVDLRGKGATVSALDQQEILAWERADVPLAAVLDGIDAAFARKAEPPKSVRDCKRWVTKQAKLHATRSGVAPAAAADAAQQAVARAVDAGGWEQRAPAEVTAAADVARRWLLALGEEADPRIHRAAVALREEVESVIQADGSLPDAMLAVLEDALATLLLAELDAPDAASVRVAVASAANHARERGLPDAAVEARRRRALRQHVAVRIPWEPLGAGD